MIAMEGAEVRFRATGRSVTYTAAVVERKAHVRLDAGCGVVYM